jgi:hypothetical protein
MTVTGRPWDELEDTLTIVRLRALNAQWIETPPVGDLVAGYLQYKPPVKIEAVATPDDPSGIGSLISQFPGGGIPADR